MSLYTLMVLKNCHTHGLSKAAVVQRKRKSKAYRRIRVRNQHGSILYFEIHLFSIRLDLVLSFRYLNLSKSSPKRILSSHTKILSAPEETRIADILGGNACGSHADHVTLWRGKSFMQMILA